MFFSSLVKVLHVVVFNRTVKKFNEADIVNAHLKDLYDLHDISTFGYYVFLIVWTLECA